LTLNGSSHGAAIRGCTEDRRPRSRTGFGGRGCLGTATGLGADAALRFGNAAADGRLTDLGIETAGLPVAGTLALVRCAGRFRVPDVEVYRSPVPGTESVVCTLPLARLVTRAPCIELTSEQEERIASCPDIEQLDRWLDNLGTATSASDVFKD
jgi:hypothetical protein